MNVTPTQRVCTYVYFNAVVLLATCKYSLTTCTQSVNIRCFTKTHKSNTYKAVSTIKNDEDGSTGKCKHIDYVPVEYAHIL